MPSAGEIAKLFGFIAKETPKSTHLFNAAVGAGAKGVYNIATGRDLTEGMVGWGVMGAAGAAGWKTYKGVGLAAGVAKAEAGYAGAMARMGQRGKRAAAVAEARGFRTQLNTARKQLGLSSRGVASNKAAQKGGVVGAAAATAERHVTTAASAPAAGPIGQSIKRLRTYDMSAGPSIMGSRANHWVGQVPMSNHHMTAGPSIMRGKQRAALRPREYQQAASREAATLRAQNQRSSSNWTNMTQRVSGAWAG
jgi:hypothetical protein